MNTKTTLMMGIAIIIIAVYMQNAKNTRLETRFRQEVSTASTKGRNAAIGGGIGALAGGGTAATVGGVGITACGTGVGLPAGLLLVGIAALIGGGAGATIGAATGDTTTVITEVPYTVKLIEPAYSHEVSLAVLVLGVSTVVFGILKLFKTKTKGRQVRWS
jgi:hypothetical protein